MTGLAKPPEPLTCQKCGCVEIRTIYHAQGCSDPKCSCTNCGYGGNAKEHREHLHRHCQGCHFDWITPTLDIPLTEGAGGV